MPCHRTVLRPCRCCSGVQRVGCWRHGPATPVGAPVPGDCRSPCRPADDTKEAPDGDNRRDQWRQLNSNHGDMRTPEQRPPTRLAQDNRGTIREAVAEQKGNIQNKWERDVCIQLRSNSQEGMKTEWRKQADKWKMTEGGKTGKYQGLQARTKRRYRGKPNEEAIRK